MKCGVWNQMKIWSSHLLDNLSNCLMNLKNSGDSTGFEPMTSAMPVQCSNQLSYEVTQLRAGQFVGLMFCRERNVVWKKCYMKCGVWNQTKIWSSPLLDNLSNCLMNMKNSGDSTGCEPMTSAMPVQCSNQLSYEVTQLRAGQFVGLMFSRERNVVWKKCYMKCGVWNQMKLIFMILACAGQFKQLFHEPEKFRWLNGIRTHWVTWIFQVHETIA